MADVKLEDKEKKSYDISTESIVIGSFFKNPDLYIEYGTLIRSKYDFFDEHMRFLFDSFETFYKTFSQEVTDSKVNTFMLQQEDRKIKYKKIGGWKTINRMMSLCDENDFKNHFDRLKKYSLIREFDKKGFPVGRILNHPKFDKITAEQVIQSMRASVDKIHTIIGGGEDSVVLGSDMKSSVLNWRKSPAMGIEFPWENWTNLFRGWRLKKLFVDGMLSNEGKSRRMTFLAAFISLILGKKILIMANEMDEEDIKAGMITAVCNNPVFGFEYNIPERNIVLGDYDSEEQADKVLEVAEYIENNTKIYFKEMSDYSDTSIEHEVKKHTLGLGVEYFFYDTLKGHKSDNWETVKQTTTKLKDICMAMNVGGYATIQLTDDSLFIDIFDFSSNNIANAKQLKHVVDCMVLEKRIHIDDYSRYTFVDSWGQGERELDRKKMYYGQKVDKNRGGGKGMVLLTEVDLDLNTWYEVGILKKNMSSSKQKNRPNQNGYGKK